MADIFTWVPDDKPSGAFKIDLREVRFGDGYRQVSKNGLNVRTQNWPLSFDRDFATIAAIQNFLDSHEGLWFLWTPPGSNAVQGKYIVMQGYGKTPSIGINEKITVMFEEFIAP